KQKRKLADTIRKKEQTDPDWLKRLIAAHLRRVRFFWRLFPDLLSFRFRRLARLKGRQRLLHFPSALAGFLVALLAGWLAGRFLRRGATHYWPDTRSQDLGSLTANESGTADPAPAITCK